MSCWESPNQRKQANEASTTKEQEPRWHEWNVPTLREPCIQANVNVVKLEASQDSTYDYWLTISTLEKGHPIAVPVKLAPYHKEALRARHKRDRAKRRRKAKLRACLK